MSYTSTIEMLASFQYINHLFKTGGLNWIELKRLCSSLFLSILLLLILINSAFAQVNKYDHGFKIINETREVYFEDEARVEVTVKEIDASLSEYMSAVTKDQNQKFQIINPHIADMAPLDGSKIQAVGGSSSDFEGDTCTTHRNAVEGCIQASGNVTLHWGGLGGASISVDATATSHEISNPAITPQSQVEIDWTCYGITGTTSVVVANYNVTSDWKWYTSKITRERSQSGLIAYSALAIYGNHKYRDVYDYNFNVLAQLEEI